MFMIDELVTYLTVYWQPVLILLIGVATLALTGFIHWYGSVKSEAVKWIARRIFKNGFGSGAMADNLVMVLSSFLVVVGMLWIGVAILYLTN